MKIKNKIVLIILSISLLVSSVSFLGYGLTTSKSNQLVYVQTANYLEVLSEKIESQLDWVANLTLNVANAY